MSGALMLPIAVCGTTLNIASIFYFAGERERIKMERL